MKTCVGCGAEFRPNRPFQTYCTKRCREVRRQERRRPYQASYTREKRAADPEKYRAQARARYAADPQKHRAKAREYYASHPEIYREATRRQRSKPGAHERERQYREEHREHYRKLWQDTEYRRNTPEYKAKRAAQARARRARNPKAREYSRRYYLEHREQYAQAYRERRSHVLAALAKVKPKARHRPKGAKAKDTPYRITMIANCRLQGLNDYKIAPYAYPLQNRVEARWNNTKAFIRRHDAAIRERTEQLKYLAPPEREAVIEQARRKLRAAN